MTLVSHSLAPDADFLPAAARRILDFAATQLSGGDLADTSLLLPNLKLAPALATALRDAHGGPLLLPRVDTVNGMVEPWQAALDALPDARRQLILHALLRKREWFDESLLWDVVGELTQLFDELTEHAVVLPEEEGELLARLEAAFSLRASAALAFEARLVNTLWRAEAQGQPSRAAARLLAAGRWLAQLQGPLIVIAESAGPDLGDRLAEQAATRVPVLLLRPQRALAEGELARLLAATWPLDDDAPSLRERAVTLDPALARRTRERLRLVAADSFENLGQAVADQVLDWLRRGRRHIALVACDRLAARRARALLEREQVLVQDETGWKLSTTRVAATVDAWHEVLASDAWHRALLDLLRAPLLFGDLDGMQRGRGCEAVARLIQKKGLLSGWDRILEASADEDDAMRLLMRLVDARTAMNTGQSASIAEWLRRLRASLAQLGAWSGFEADMAGRAWIEWLEARSAELAEDKERFGFAAWRTWFNRQMDSSLFRDERIDSPVIMTHLAATRLRSFDAAIVIGADSEHLAPPTPPGWLDHAGVRRELGLPGLDIEKRRLREDLAGLLLACGESAIAWQSQRRDEVVMPAPEVAVLAAVLNLARGSSAVEAAPARFIGADPSLRPEPLPAPSVATERVPTRLSASGMQTLIDCPYHYFARYVLRLAEQEELAEGMEKRDFGEQLHGILNEFHRRFPRLAGHDDGVLLEAFEAITEEAFAAPVMRNFQDHAWRLRWRARLPGYLDWQRAREAAGWQWQGGELERTLPHELGRGRAIELFGRIDRVDAGPEGDALLDYKSRGLDALKRQARDPDDVQLAFYSLLHGGHVSETAYVALDDDPIASVATDDPQARAAALQDRITETFNALHEGAGMPANAAESVCSRCEMRGLCRREWLEESE